MAGKRSVVERSVGALGAKRLGPAIKPVGHGRVTGAEYLAPFELRVPDTQVLSVVDKLRHNSAVSYAEPNYLEQGSATPNDEEFGLQWGDQNTGQLIPTQNANEELGAEGKGTPGAEDHAAAAWNVSTGSRSIVIGEVDTGVDYEHPDLAANIWNNPTGVGENAKKEKCAVGTHGYNVVSGICNPMDEDTSYGGHGTHVAGILGAVGNNREGVAGMNWQTTILPVKWMNNAGEGGGLTSNLVTALNWLVAAKQAGVNIRVVNDSDVFPGVAKSTALGNAIELLGANNILFVTAAGNTGENNDLEATQRYPCKYDFANEICATASNNKDELPSWANFGPKTVNLAAPGVSIFSTLRGGKYGYLSGGSMAAPQVAGAAALVLSVKPSFTAEELKADIVEHVDKLPSLEGKVITGGRLDVCKAMPGCTANEPPPPTTFGKTSVGGSSDTLISERKRVNRYALTGPGSVTKLSIYLAPTGTSGQQVLKGLIYADSSGTPGALLGVSEQLTFKSTNSAGWYDLVFSSPVKLTAGNYWIGIMTGATGGIASFRWESVSGSRVYNANPYSSGPTNPFGAATTDSEQTSLYATYTPTPPPVNTASPTIAGTAQQGQTLTEHNGTWENSPTSFAYQWLQCDSSGTSCLPISGATGQSYVPLAADVGHTIEVSETASNAGGAGTPANSSATAVVSAAPPVNTALPTLTGTVQQGQTLTEHNGTWTNEPTSFTYQWLRCDSSGANCSPITGATAQTYTLLEADLGNTIRVQETASNPGGTGTPAVSSPTEVVVAPVPVPVNAALPTITGTAQQGQTLTEHHGSWMNEPTGYTYQWLECESLGSGCMPIVGATKQTYVPAATDVGHTIEVEETARNAGGPGSPATSIPTTAVEPPPPPTDSSPPTISGTAQQGQTLSASNGSWANEPTEYKYQWQRCDTTGANCSPISGATAQTYPLVEADVGSTVRVAVTAYNAGGHSSAVSSEQTVVVVAALHTFGKTTVGASSDYFGFERKRVNRYALATAGSVTRLSVYLAPTGTSGQQVLKGLIYADASGTPAALLGVTEQLTFKSTNSAGWYELVFPSPVKLEAGSYWIGVMTGATAKVAGFRYDSVSGSRDYNTNAYASGPTNPFGAATTDSEQTSLYATYAPG
ncbi:MAG TPA: S8 family serine peptidase [Solirubrobacteraceae bacterium]|nr:S8 family serine peptidase [Solirubrobacteraceae bacterium]